MLDDSVNCNFDRKKYFDFNTLHLEVTSCEVHAAKCPEDYKIKYIQKLSLKDFANSPGSIAQVHISKDTSCVNISIRGSKQEQD